MSLTLPTQAQGHFKLPMYLSPVIVSKNIPVNFTFNLKAVIFHNIDHQVIIIRLIIYLSIRIFRA